MNSVTLILRPDLGKRAYRLHCRMITPAFPKTDLLEKSRLKVGQEFIDDMAEQGWEYLDRYGMRMNPEPKPHVETVTLPKRHLQANWHTPSRELLPAVMAGYRARTAPEHFVTTLPNMAFMESWEWDLSAVFVRKTILTETPDPHEERSK